VNCQATHQHNGRAISAERQRASDLLGRYPRLSDGEVAEIVTFLKTGRQLEIGLLTSDPSVRPALDAFMAEHKAQFRLKWSERVAVAAGVFGVPIGIWALWEALA
jgi:hypothetical protein